MTAGRTCLSSSSIAYRAWAGWQMQFQKPLIDGARAPLVCPGSTTTGTTRGCDKLAFTTTTFQFVDYVVMPSLLFFFFIKKKYY